MYANLNQLRNLEIRMILIIGANFLRVSLILAEIVNSKSRKLKRKNMLLFFYMVFACAYTFSSILRLIRIQNKL